MSAAVGADIEALCSKCGDVWHVVVAKVGEEIVRVICKECGAQHRYRHPSKAPTRRSSSSTTPRTPREPKVVERFATPAVAADLSKPVRTYKASEQFEVAERIDHPTFGQGVVELSEPGKVTVFFAVGRKILVQARAAPASGGLARPRPFDHSQSIAMPGPVGAGIGHGPGPAGDDEDE